MEHSIARFLNARSSITEAKEKLQATVVEVAFSGSATKVVGRVSSKIPGKAKEPALRYLQRAGDFDGALRAAEQWVAKDPKNPAALRRLGFILHHEGKLPEAIEVYSKLIQLGSQADGDFGYYNRALCYVGEKEFALAEIDFWNVSDKSPNFEKALDGVLTCLESRRASLADKQTALIEIAQALNSSELYVRLAGIQESLLDLNGALESLSKAEHISSLDTDAYYLRARIEEKLGLQRAAEQSYEAAVFGLRQSERPFGKASLHSKMRNWSKAFAAFQDEEPAAGIGLGDYFYEYGIAAENCGNWGEAALCYWKALSIDGRRRYTAYRLGVSLERSGRLHEAALAYEGCAEMGEEEKYSSFYHAGRLYAENGEFDKACNNFFRSKIGDPWRNYFYPARRSSWLASINLEGVDGAKSGVLSLVPVLISSLQSGDLTKALSLAKKLCFLKEDFDASLHWLIGSIQARLGNLEDACDSYMTMSIASPPYIQGVSRPRSSFALRKDQYITFRETLPIDSKKILYEVGHGSSISCNPLAIYRQMQRRFPGQGWKHVWIVTNGTEIPIDLRNQSNVTFVKRESERYFRELASAKYLINNTSFGSYFVRRPGQRYVNTWHGTPLKTLGMRVKGEFLSHGNITRNFLQCTDLAVGNDWTAKVLTEDYGLQRLFSGQILKNGVARVDELINPDRSRQERIRAELLGGDNRPVLLYAPTWRGLVNSDPTETFDLDAELDVVREAEAAGYRVLYSAHRFVRELASETPLSQYFIPVGFNSYDVLPFTDVLLTDYSSIYFDFLPLDKPIVFYMYDYEEYKEQRGLYELELPGRKCDSLQEVIEELHALRNGTDRFADSRARALEEFAPDEDGHACDRIIDAMLAPLPSRIEKSPVFVFRQSFLANGIAASFRALAFALVEKFGAGSVLVFVDKGSLESDPNRRAQLELLDPRVAVYPRAGGALFSQEELYLDALRNGGTSMLSEEQVQSLDSAYRREWARAFGDSAPTAVVEFDGYANFWAHLFGSAPKESAKLIYLHNEMEQERISKHAQLDTIFQEYRLFDAAVSVSESVDSANRNYLEKYFDSPLSGCRSEWANNLLDVNKIASADIAEIPNSVRALIEAGQEYIALVARLSQEKAHLRSLEVYSQFPSPKPKLVIVGEGPQRPEIEKAIADRGLAGQVVLTGFVENPLGVVSHAKALGLLSKWEGQGLTLLEAMAIGTPVVATDIPGPRSIIEAFGGGIVENSSEGVYEAFKLMFEEKIPKSNLIWRDYNQEALDKFVQIISDSSSVDLQSAVHDARKS
ncbi:CDP-glycerol glycerophosphotransferase family protein [Corynebacterium phoceense]|uniref:CDP-glycerol glycerophosphotransferase family protein n=1 Tax=Corynebacterium phoceense TaxID=1686286 RepID=UPI00211BACD2|nr:CDP-glycerol glycerophosphotransferase family protein [Corynebacterium phoceense]MCQ9337088.1 CDP-glycerol glycerophosphotransferase family protein [Corynebacterium phoceense]